MNIKKDGIIIDPKNKKTDTEYVSDELVEKISKQIEEQYAEALTLLAKGPEDTNNE